MVRWVLDQIIGSEPVAQLYEGIDQHGLAIHIIFCNSLFRLLNYTMIEGDLIN